MRLAFLSKESSLVLVRILRVEMIRMGRSCHQSASWQFAVFFEAASAVVGVVTGMVGCIVGCMVDCIPAAVPGKGIAAAAAAVHHIADFGIGADYIEGIAGTVVVLVEMQGLLAERIGHWRRNCCLSHPAH